MRKVEVVTVVMGALGAVPGHVLRTDFTTGKENSDKLRGTLDSK